MIVTSALHARSVSDYKNDDDIEAALRESWPSVMPATTRRRASTPSRLPQDVALVETASSDYLRKDKANHCNNGHDNDNDNDNDDSESGSWSPMTVEDELRRLKALKAFQILEPTATTTCRSIGEDDENVLSSCMSPALNDGIVHVVPSPPPNNSDPAEEEATAANDLRSTIRTMERLVDMATRMFQVPMAVISVTDLGRQKILASKGLGDDDNGKKVNELPRHISPCAYVVADKDEAFILPYAQGHERIQGSPIEHAQFYAAVPLITPEGERIGAVCIVDTTKPRPQGLSPLELQDLQHIAALAMQSLVERRSRLNLVRKLQKATRVVSATVHDLLTPLTAVELALSLLHEDQDFQGKLSQHQKESVKIASNCIGVLGRMCRRMRDQHSASCKRQVNGYTTSSTASTSISSNKYGGEAHNSAPASLQQLSNADFGLTAESFRIMYGTGGDDSLDGIPCRSNDDDSSALFETKVLAAPRVTVGIQDLVKSIHMAMDAIPKTIPIAIALHASVPSRIVTDDLKVLRCALNLLQHCASVATTGSIQLSIKAQYCRCGKEMLGFYCQLRPEDNDTTTTSDLTNNILAANQCIHECCSTSRAGFDSSESSSSSSLSVSDHHVCCHSSGHLLKQSLRSCAEINLYSVAMQMDAIGGDCGIENAGNPSGESFWFRVPLEELEEPEPAAPVAQVAPLSSPKDPKSMCIDTCCAAESETTKNREQTLLANDDSIALVLEAQPRKRRALIIEDSIVIRKVIANALAKIGIEAETAVNGMEGLHHLQGSVYDVVLCDFLMPVMDGLDCVKQYREWEKTHRPFIHQYIIGMSAHASEQDVERGIRAGMDCYKPKPLTYKGLKDIVDACEKNQKNLISHALDEHDGNPISKISSSGQTSRTSKVKSPERVQPKMCLIASKEECYDLARLTEARGWKSLIVHDGEDALQALKKRNWDAVLLDEKLPLLSGRRCVNEFREWEKENRVNSQTDMYILINSKKDDEMEGTIQVPAGANGVVRKPVRPKEFEHILLKAEEPSLNIIMR